MTSILSAAKTNKQSKPYGWTTLIQEKPDPTFAAYILSNVGNLFKTPHVSRCIVPKLVALRLFRLSMIVGAP